MIDIMRKMLAKAISSRLSTFVYEVGGLLDNQCGFRKNWLTQESIVGVKQIAEEAISGNRWRGGQNKYCANWVS